MIYVIPKKSHTTKLKNNKNLFSEYLVEEQKTRLPLFAGRN